MKKFYSFIIMALFAIAANAQEPVSINELRGTWVFRGVANDWNSFGETLPTVHTFNLSVDEETNAVTATTTMGTVWAYGEAEDGSEDYEDVLRGTFNPETQILTFGNSYDEVAGIYSYLEDEWYYIYTYTLAFKVAHDENGKVVFNMVAPEGAETMLVLEYSDYDWDTAEWAYYYYGYDLGATMTAPVNGALKAGEYEIAYTNESNEAATMPCEIKESAEGLVLVINGAEITLGEKSTGFGANKVVYAYEAEDTYTEYGEGDEDYYYNFAAAYSGAAGVTFYANGNDTYTGSVAIYTEDIDGNSTVLYDPVLYKRGQSAIESVENETVKTSAPIYFDLSGRRISKPQGLHIEMVNGKAVKRLAK